ncbi:MAG: hypothetical protein JWP38_1686 [Herbaspirillum sp.]|jgi:hypothetical protein|nr:hypothetical protein [Herbaspirillum sp.]
MFMTAVRGHSQREEAELLELTITLLAVTEILVTQTRSRSRSVDYEGDCSFKSSSLLHCAAHGTVR